MSTDLSQFRQTYIAECFELLADMEARLMELDVGAAGSEALNAIFRCAHSIKGGAGAFGLQEIGSLTHVMEALLDSLRDGRVAPSRASVDMLLKARDIVLQMVEAARDGVKVPENLGADIKAALQSAADGTPNASPSTLSLEDKPTPPQVTSEVHAPQSWRIGFTPYQTLFMTGNEPILILRELARLGQTVVTAFTGQVPTLSTLDPTRCYLSWIIILSTDKPESAIREVFEFVTDHCDLRLVNITLQTSGPVSEKLPEKKMDALPALPIVSCAPAAAPVTTAASPPAEDPVHAVPHVTSIRVDLEKVDRLVNMVGELVITEAMLHALMRDFTMDKLSGLLGGLSELSQHTRELQEAVMSVRMQPVHSVFARMPRLVRDLAAQLNKDIRLVMVGEATEVDKTVIEQLSDPLTHMIRNACDHGIETPAVRLEKGKSAQGTINLSAAHRGGRIVIEIRDDGAGIDRARVLAKARSKGLVATDAQPAEDEIDAMIFLPGFSTAEQVTNVSGRGVGMDVVKRNIAAMGGHVRISNTPGQGACMTVSLPLTLAILDGMIVRVGKELYIVPIANILETLRPTRADVRRLEQRGDVINVRGEFIPLVYLGQVFSVPNTHQDPAASLVILVESNQQRAGLVVDELVGQQQVVIKSLEANADPVRGVSGATILGDGRVSLILEISDLTLMRASTTAHAWAA